MALGHALRLPKLSDHRKDGKGYTSELGASWLLVHRHLDRARRRLLRSNWLKAHLVVGPLTSTIGSAQEEPSDNEDPPTPPPEVDCLGGNVSGGFPGESIWEAPKEEGSK